MVRESTFSGKSSDIAGRTEMDQKDLNLTVVEWIAGLNDL